MSDDRLEPSGIHEGKEVSKPPRDKRGWWMGIKAALGFAHRPVPPHISKSEISEIAAEIDRMGQTAELISREIRGEQRSEDVEQALRRIARGT